MADNEELAKLLREIRDDQREALALQRKQQQLMERAEALQARAESLQGSAGKAIKVMLWIALPVIVFVLAMVVWPYLRYMFG